jgi:hypothetical protein
MTQWIRGLVRAAEAREQEGAGCLWDDEMREALAEARRLGWGRHRVGYVPEVVERDVTIARLKQEALDHWTLLNQLGEAAGAKPGDVNVDVIRDALGDLESLRAELAERAALLRQIDTMQAALNERSALIGSLDTKLDEAFNLLSDVTSETHQRWEERRQRLLRSRRRSADPSIFGTMHAALADDGGDVDALLAVCGGAATVGDAIRWVTDVLPRRQDRAVAHAEQNEKEATAERDELLILVHNAAKQARAVLGELEEHLSSSSAGARVDNLATRLSEALSLLDDMPGQDPRGTDEWEERRQRLLFRSGRRSAEDLRADGIKPDGGE